MGKGIAEADLAAIVDVLKGHAQGLVRGAILSKLSGALTPRQLSRRLGRLLEAGMIQVVGERRARRYFIEGASPQAHVPSASAKRTASSAVIELSAASVEIRNTVVQSVAARHPVGYRVDFLDAYEPNVTAY